MLTCSLPVDMLHVMTTEQSEQLTLLLQEWQGGDDQAFEQLLPLVLDELKSISSARVRGEHRFATMTASDVMNEAVIRLMGADIDWRDRRHFFAISSRIMRRVLIDHARARLRGKRGGDAPVLTLAEELVGYSEEAMLELDQALTRLGELDERKAQALELHYFGGLTYEELAETLDIGLSTVDRDMRFAKAWLQNQLRPED